MYERAILRIGAVCLGVGLITAVVFEALHPAGKTPTTTLASSPSTPSTAIGPPCIWAPSPAPCC